MFVQAFRINNKIICTDVKINIPVVVIPVGYYALICMFCRDGIDCIGIGYFSINDIVVDIP